jgi:hypothetical protein
MTGDPMTERIFGRVAHFSFDVRHLRRLASRPAAS